MGRNIDRGLDKRSETKRDKNSSKTSKIDKVKKETSKKLNDNFKK